MNTTDSHTDFQRSRALTETRHAFDQVAEEYDGSLGNNALIQDLRKQFLSTVHHYFSAGDHLLDLGCGTGLDAVTLAREHYHINAVDWSEEMVNRTRRRAAHSEVSDQVSCYHAGGHQLDMFADRRFDGLYSNLGVINCIMNLERLADGVARILKDEGVFIASVINRICPWEIGHYLLRGKWKRALIRFKRTPVAVNLEGNKVWTRYLLPRELYEYFKHSFYIKDIRTMNLFAPPPYRLDWAQQHPKLYGRLQQLDERIGGWPLIRNLGDHFLIVMRKQS